MPQGRQVQSGPDFSPSLLVPQCPAPNSGPLTQVYSSLTAVPFQHHPVLRLAPPHSSGLRKKVQWEAFSDRSHPHNLHPSRSGLHCILYSPLAYVLALVMAASMSAFPSGLGGRVSAGIMSVPLPLWTPTSGTAADPEEGSGLSFSQRFSQPPSQTGQLSQPCR